MKLRDKRSRWPTRNIVLLALVATLTGLVPPVTGQAHGPDAGNVTVSNGQESHVVTDIAYPALAFDSTGGGWAVWEQTGTFDGRPDSEIMVSRGQGDQWSPAERLSPDPATWDHAPALAVDAADRVWVAWSRSTGTDDAVWIARWEDGGWTGAEQVSPPGVVSRFPALAAGPQGAVWLAWSSIAGNNYELFVRRWNGAAWEPAVQLTHDTGEGAYDWAPSIAVAGDGAVWVAWPRHEANGDDSIFVTSGADGVWSEPVRVSASDGTPDDAVALALAPGGQPWLAWIGWDPVDGTGDLVTAARQEAGWAEERRVPDAAVVGVPHDPALAVDRQGVAHLAWISGRDLLYSRWAGARWLTPRRVNPGRPATDFAALAIDDGGRLAFGWHPSRLTFRVSRFVPDALPELPTVDAGRSPAPRGVRPAAVIGRLVGLGDSITFGGYNAPNTYPALLEQQIDEHVYPSEVINEGVPGEWTSEGYERLPGVLDRWDPQYLLVMEGTNDITHYKSNTPTRVTVNLKSDMELAKQRSVRAFLATVPPRSDDKEDETEEVNNRIRGLANDHHYSLADQWAAVSSYPGWQNYLQYAVHPYGPLMDIITNTWYDSFLTLSWINEDTVPPFSSMVALPATTEGSSINAGWAGTDSGNAGSDMLGTGIAAYDVQVRDGPAGAWADWLTETTTVTGTYVGGLYGHTYYFRSRARDRAGNWESLNGSLADTFTQLVDSTPPSSYVLPLYPYRQGAFTVQWVGQDSGSGIASYDVQYRVGATGSWQDWSTGTTATEATFGPLSPVSLSSGETYYFRSRARDQASNQETYPSGDGDAWTTIADYGFSGHVFGNRGLPLHAAEVRASDGALNTGISDYAGHYEVYVAGSGNYVVTPTQKIAGPLPSLPPLTVSSIVTGVNFVLPPALDYMSNGGFEAGWNAWVKSGALSPTIATDAHSGQGALLLAPGEGAGQSAAGQTPWIPSDLSRPTLSFLYRVAGTGTGTLSVSIGGGSEPITHTLPLAATTWAHHWIDLGGVGTQNPSILFMLEREGAGDSLKAWIDEASLGPAMPGSSFVFLPVTIR